MTHDGERWALYRRPPSQVLAFHGCDRTVGEAILNGKVKHLARSANDYDWLGHGTYFWESNPQRALEFAEEAKSNPRISKGKIKNPFVIGAVIDLGHCLNLMDSSALQEVDDAHTLLMYSFEDERAPPVNGTGLRARKLDCAVIETLHAYRGSNDLQPYDSVRGMFTEGSELYAGAGFRRQDHIQICIKTDACIRGYFRPIET